MTIKKISALDARGRRGTTNWNAVKKMTDAEIKRSALSDPEAKEPLDNELKKFRRSRL